MKGKEETIKVLETYFGLQDVEQKLENNRLHLIGEFMRSVHSKCPYNNVKLLMLEHEERRTFTPEEIIHDCTSGIGGTCHVLNTFVNIVLCNLGFNAVVNGCTMSILPNIPNHHLVNIIYDVEKPGDIHLVDPAGWYPTFGPVSLHDIDTNPRTYTSSFHEYKFEKEGNTYTRKNKKGGISDLSVGGEEVEWRAFYYFNMPPVEKSVIDECLNNTYKHKTSGILKFIICSVYPEGTSITIATPNVRVYDEATKKMTTTNTTDPQELYNILKPHWPELSFEKLQKAISHLPPPTSEPSH